MNHVPQRRDLPGHQTRRQHLMNEISTPPRSTSKLRLVLAGLGTAAAVGGVAAAALLAPGGTSTGTPGKAKLMAASEVLTKASDAAAAEPDLKPKPDQYLYFSSQSRQNGGGIDVRKIWLSVDGKHATLLDSQMPGFPKGHGWICSNKKGEDMGGKAGDLKNPPTNCHDRPAYDPTIPTDPKAAKAWLYKNSMGGNPPDIQAFITVGDTIREHYIGSKSLAALFKAAAQIPGVTVYRNVRDSAGRVGIAVGQTWRYDRHELIFDPKTFRLIGEQEVCDTVTSFHPAGESKTDLPSKVWCKNGQVSYSSAELGFGLVNRPGQLP